MFSKNSKSIRWVFVADPVHLAPSSADTEKETVRVRECFGIARREEHLCMTKKLVEIELKRKCGVGRERERESQTKKPNNWALGKEEVERKRILKWIWWFVIWWKYLKFNVDRQTPQVPRKHTQNNGCPFERHIQIGGYTCRSSNQMLGTSCLAYAEICIWLDRYVAVGYDHTFNLTCSVHFLTILRKGDQKKSVVSEERGREESERERRERKKTFKVDDKKCGLHLELERLLKSYLAQLQDTRIKKEQKQWCLLDVLLVEEKGSLRFFSSPLGIDLLPFSSDWDGGETYLSTMIPARMAWATLLNFGLSEGRRLMVDIERVKVIASQSRTSLGTESGSISDKAPSSSSISRLEKINREEKSKWKCKWTCHEHTHQDEQTCLFSSRLLFSLNYSFLLCPSSLLLFPFNSSLAWQLSATVFFPL